MADMDNEGNDEIFIINPSNMYHGATFKYLTSSINKLRDQALSFQAKIEKLENRETFKSQAILASKEQEEKTKEIGKLFTLQVEANNKSQECMRKIEALTYQAKTDKEELEGRIRKTEELLAGQTKINKSAAEALKRLEMVSNNNDEANSKAHESMGKFGALTSQAKIDQEELEDKIRKVEELLARQTKVNKEGLEETIENIKKLSTIQAEANNKSEESMRKIEGLANQAKIDKEELEDRIRKMGELLTSQTKVNKEELQEAIRNMKELPAFQAEAKNQLQESMRKIEALTNQAKADKEEFKNTIRKMEELLTYQIKTSREELEDRTGIMSKGLDSIAEANKNSQKVVTVLQAQVEKFQDELAICVKYINDDIKLSGRIIFDDKKKGATWIMGVGMANLFTINKNYDIGLAIGTQGELYGKGQVVHGGEGNVGWSHQYYHKV